MKNLLIFRLHRALNYLLFFGLLQISSFAQVFDMKQTLSDGAQRNTIAFNGLAFLTGNFCSCTFIPPGKVADYFSFQYVRDNDITNMGHNTDFLTVLANNALYVLSEKQKAELISVAKNQVSLINLYAQKRFALIDGFIRLRDHTFPSNSSGLQQEMVEQYSAELYKIDAELSIERAKFYASIINSLTDVQKKYIDSVYALGMKNMPKLPEQIDKRPLNNNQFVAAMSLAGDIFTWYVGSLEKDVYFCPERQGNYFGSFYIKDAPAIGNNNYSIDTNLTQNGGVNFLKVLTKDQSAQITSLVELQKSSLLSLVEDRTTIARELRKLLNKQQIDTTLIYSVSSDYGKLDGRISYLYATHFASVYWSLNQVQKDSLKILRNLDKYPCSGAYLYSDPISTPTNLNSDIFFFPATSVDEAENSRTSTFIYPNPASDIIHISLGERIPTNVTVRLLSPLGQIIWETIPNKYLHSSALSLSLSDIPNVCSGTYYISISSDEGSELRIVQIVR